MTEERLFELLVNTPAAERAAALDRLCGADAALRGRLEALLAADGTHLREPPTADAPAGTAAYDPDGTRPVPDSVGEAGQVVADRYKLVERIGEGGMGTVWMAQQTAPVRRAVAVKLIKPGMDSKAVLARFEAERQALALMDHPHIARVFDGGVTDDGRPYFAMELVKGVPITKFCDDRRLTPRQRLELFVQVCQAVQHAHQKGVIHRDLKPSNVLVALYDDKPVPKVIDFGVAKATGAALTDRTLMTGFGAVVGTPEYMSPEQASFNAVDVDTRSDVYALGVLLYELLTGTTPVDRKSLRQAAVLEILRIVREVDPPRPSARLSTADALPSIAAVRGTEPKKLTGLLRSELDWVVMKALEKDRQRRYDTANGLAADVQRYLAGEPVQAHPPSAGYRVRTFMRKHKGPVLTAAVVALALLLGFAGTGAGLVQADERRREAERARADEADQRALVVRANGELESTNGELGKVNTTLEKTNGELGKANADLTAARQKLEISLARSLLMPFRDKPEPPTYRPEDVRDEMTATEALGVWRVSESVDDRLTELLVSEAIREPVATRQLGYRAPYLLQAAVGLHPDRRQRIEALLSAELDKPNQSPDRIRGVVSTMAALGGLTPETARRAVDAYHPIRLAEEYGAGLEVCLELHRHLTAGDRTGVAERYAGGLAQQLAPQHKVDALADLLAGLPVSQAVRICAQALRDTRDEQGRHRIASCLFDQYARLGDPAAGFTAVAEAYGGVDKVEPGLLARMFRLAASAPSARSAAKPAAERAVKLHASMYQPQSGGTVLFLSVAPLLDPADAEPLAARAAVLLRQARAAEPEVRAGVYMLSYTAALARVSAYLPIPARLELIREEVGWVESFLKSVRPMAGALKYSPEFPNGSEDWHRVCDQLCTLAWAHDSAARAEVWARWADAAISGAKVARLLADKKPESGQSPVRTSPSLLLQERLALAAKFAGRAGGEVGKRVWVGMLESVTTLLIAHNRTPSELVGLALTVLPADDGVSLVMERATAAATYASVVAYAEVLLVALPVVSAELGENASGRMVALLRAAVDRQDRGQRGPAERYILLLTRYMKPLAGLEAGREILAGVTNLTYREWADWAESLAVLAGRLPRAEVPKECEEVFRILRGEAQRIATTYDLSDIARGLIHLRPFVAPEDFEAACSQTADRMLTALKADPKVGGGLVLPALLPHLPPGRRAAELDRSLKLSIRNLADAADLPSRLTAASVLAKRSVGRPVSPAVYLEPLARSGGFGGGLPLRYSDAIRYRDPLAVERGFRQSLTPWTESEAERRQGWLLLAAGSGGLPPAGLTPAVAVGLQPPCPLTDQELVDLLKHPFCVGGARRAVLDVLQERFRTPFADQWAFVKYATDHKLPLDLTTPVKRSVE